MHCAKIVCRALIIIIPVMLTSLLTSLLFLQSCVVAWHIEPYLAERGAQSVHLARKVASFRYDLDSPYVLVISTILLGTVAGYLSIKRKDSLLFPLLWLTLSLVVGAACVFNLLLYSNAISLR